MTVLVPDTSLASDYVTDVVSAAANFIETAEAGGVKLNIEFHQFLELYIYIGRVQNSGHRALLHQNYQLPLYTQTCSDAAGTLDLDELQAVITEFETFALSSNIQAQREAIAHFENIAPELANDFKTFDVRLFNDKVTPKQFAETSDVITAPTKDWMLGQVHAEVEECRFYVHAAAWLKQHPDVRTCSGDEYDAACDHLVQNRPVPPPLQPVKKPGFWQKLFGK